MVFEMNCNASATSGLRVPNDLLPVWRKLSVSAYRAWFCSSWSKSMTRKSGCNTDDTFASGNLGKAKGIRSKTTWAALALLDGEAEALPGKP